MRKFHILATAAALLVAATAPSLAAKRTQQTSDAYGAYARDVNADRSGSYHYGPNRTPAAQAAPHGAQGFGAPGYVGGEQNLQSPDRGDLGGW
jgi:hypothetical protein